MINFLNYGVRYDLRFEVWPYMYYLYNFNPKESIVAIGKNQKSDTSLLKVLLRKRIRSPTYYRVM